MPHVILQGKRVVIDGQSFPMRLSMEPFLKKLQNVILASNGATHSTKIGSKFLNEFGGSLYKAIIPPVNLQKGPIILDIKERGFSQLPWELMRANGEWLAKTRGIVRISGQGRGFHKSGNVYGPLKVLVALASPLYRIGAKEQFQPDPINLRSQVEIFTHVLKRKRFAATFNIQQHITRRRLGDELSRDYHVLHFVGHGSRGILTLEDDNACVDEIDSLWLKENLSNSLLHLALFNSCNTASYSGDTSCAGIAKTLLDAGIPLVVGMQFAFTEGAARAFAHKFYRALAEGKSVVEAISFVRRAIADSPTCLPWEWITPVLFAQPDMLKNIHLPFVCSASSCSNAAIKIANSVKTDLTAIEGEEIFVGRRQEIVEILKTLSFSPYQPERVVVLKGIGGIGKTALAAQAAARLLERVDKVIWISGCNNLPPSELGAQLLGNDSLTIVNDEKDLFGQIARKFDIKLKKSVDLLQVKERILKKIGGNHNTLLLLDSMEAFRASEILRAFIKQLPLNCCVLITSRYGFPKVKAKEIELSPLSFQEILKLSRYQLDVPLKDDILRQIYDLSEGNPLVTQMLLANLATGKQKYFEFRDELYQGKPKCLFDYLFGQSLQLLEEKERAVFVAMSLFFPYALPETLACTCHLKDIALPVEKLQALSMIYVYTEGEQKRLRLPSLGRIVAQKLAENSPCIEKYRRRQALSMARFIRSQLQLVHPQLLKSLISEVLQEEEFLGEGPFVLEQAGKKAGLKEQKALKVLLESTICKAALDSLDEEKENALAALAWCASKPYLPLLRIMVDDLNLFFALRSCWKDVIAVCKIALQTMRKIDQREGEAILLNNLGIAYRNLGDWSRAKNLLEQSIEKKQELGDVYGIAQSYNNLGLVYKSLGEWKQALRIYQHNLWVFHNLGDVKAKANTYNNLGLLYQSQGYWEKAIRCHQQAIYLKEQQQDMVGVAQTKNNLGLIWQNMGRWQLAEELYQQSLEAFSRLGNTHAKGQTYSNLALLYFEQGQYQRALEFYQHVLDIFAEIGDTFGIAQAYNNIGLVYKEIGEKEKAGVFYRRSLELKEKLGDLHGQAQSYNNLGILYKEDRNWDAARNCYRQSIELKYRLGNLHGMGLSYANLGLLELNCQNYESALKMLERAANFFVKGGDENNLQKVMRALFVVNFKLQSD